LSRRGRLPALLLTFLAIALGSAAARTATSTVASEHIQTQLAQTSAPPDVWDWPRWRAPLLDLYADRRHSPLWFSQGRLTEAALGLLTELHRLERRGLLAADYDVEGFEQRIQSLYRSHGTHDAALLAQLDLWLSATAARLATDLHQGRVDPASVGHDLDIGKARLDVAVALTALADTTDTAASLDSFEPRLTHYSLLKAALARYRETAKQPALTELPAPRSVLRTGDEYAGAPQLRRLLAALGDLTIPPEDAAHDEVLDAESMAALQRFQTRHGLESDGVLGGATYRALTTPLRLRVEQMVLTLERMRWLPRLQSPPIIVNVPQFRLFAFRSLEDNASDMLRMDVIVGEAFEGRRTPVFAADMRHVVFNPYWDVPRSILLQELMPEIRFDPRWIARNGYEIVRGAGDDASRVAPTPGAIRELAAGRLRLRQQPGPSNALGRVKFIFPNDHNVYLHDTPAQALFARARRAFSHGCIRVAEPLALAAHVLRDEPGWDEARIAAALAGDRPVRVILTRPIRVFILYATALATEAGSVLFFDDIYGQDARLMGFLEKRRINPQG
jgi:murein L,D-transpeptidase YcbB/YkuD